MSLKDRLIERITLEGPMTAADYMHACLHDPADGYYATRPALGEAGDFITAPLVSQMFGELIGVWAIHVWRELGAPSRLRLVEVGPGDGTLMGDVLRAARLDPAFEAALDIWLVETSLPLRQQQEWKLSGARPRWTDRLGEVPAGAPMVLIANELLDCLPARQFVREGQGWAERMIG
ncbi:MAG TPA: SAM-dependent methyltransferase, partial [Caulobacteraceae bacterium]|nr:SAM-dependent methyltransferase [Caulobacteraceae bacterium]